MSDGEDLPRPADDATDGSTAEPEPSSGDSPRSVAPPSLDEGRTREEELSSADAADDGSGEAVGDAAEPAHDASVPNADPEGLGDGSIAAAREGETEAPVEAARTTATDGSAPPDGEAAAASTSAPSGLVGRLTRPETRSRRLLVSAFIYLVCVAVFAAVAGPPRLTHHTAFNHYAHLADAWLHGRQDLRNGPPAYAMGNDFAEYKGKTYISFPPFPAVLMVPFVALAGSPEDLRDGQLMVWLAGIGPAVLFLVLEKVRRRKLSTRSESENVALSFLLAFGTVYFFTAVEGTVWFAAHVVGVGLAALYLLFALDAERPFLAGLCLACSWMTRPSTILIGLVFAVEALRIACEARGGLPREGSLEARLAALRSRVDAKVLFAKLVPFAVPVAISLAIASAMNYSRFGNPSPTAFGHEHLSVVWKGRIQNWGLFGYHYLPKNLGVMLTILPWRPPQHMACFEGQMGTVNAIVAFVKGLFGARPACTPFQINEHGLALWFTTPIYFWLFRPKEKSYTYTLLAVAAALPCLMDLLYQNSGWRQFGYRFSNDYAVLLFVLLALGGRPMKGAWKACAVWGIAWNLFGAATFDHGEHDRFYFREGTQTVLYQND
ncbi:MAG: hypothetical protein U0183_03605 [Polyangiaceae bacterium]